MMMKYWGYELDFFCFVVISIAFVELSVLRIYTRLINE